MCGIVGILGKEPVAFGIVEALRRLEYRGYDSAGIATLENGNIERRRAPGKLRNLEETPALRTIDWRDRDRSHTAGQPTAPQMKPTPTHTWPATLSSFTTA